MFGPDSNDQISSDGSEQDWVEPSLSCKSGLLQPQGAESVYHAFYLLQTDPSIQVHFSVYNIKQNCESQTFSCKFEINLLGHRSLLICV